MSADCLFCKIVEGKIPAKRVYEDELCLCFADINPQAPTHLLIIPKEHIASQAHAEEEHAALLGHMVAKAAEVARNAGLVRGYRVVITPADAGAQPGPPLLLPLLGGRNIICPRGKISPKRQEKKGKRRR